MLLILLSISLMLLDKRTVVLTQVRVALSMPLVPLQYVVSTPIQWVDSLRDAINTHDRLVQENLQLKAEQLRLHAQVQRLQAIEVENSQLKALMHSTAQIQGKVLVAQLLAVANNPFAKQVWVDKGRRNEVRVGLPVLDANGLMGQVIETNWVNSRVLLINDSHSGVPVEVARNGVRAIAVGDAYTGKLRLLNVPQTADIQPGDTLITSGLGEHFPEGYPVGVVLRVTKEPGVQFAMILVEPKAHLDQSRGVLLVWPPPSTAGASS